MSSHNEIKFLILMFIMLLLDIDLVHNPYVYKLKGPLHEWISDKCESC